jgi:hypothetical protein
MDLALGDIDRMVTRFSDRTRDMFRSILTENGVADVEDAILDQEIVILFKLSEPYLERVHGANST